MMDENQPPVGKKSWLSLWSTNRVTMAFAALGVLAAASATVVVLHNVGLIKFDLLRFLSDSDEAPIRVRNGSLDLLILSDQEWEQIGASGQWRMANADRHKPEFEVTIAVATGATCGGSTTATGSDIVLTFENDDDPSTTSTSKIRLESQGRRTVVKPGNGVTMTWDPKPGERQKLSYKTTGGYLQSIAVGNGANPATICSFSGPSQLVHMIILNTP